MLRRPSIVSSMRFAPLLMALLATAAAAAQSCPRPAPSGLGHAIVTEPMQVVTYGDGYVTEGELLRPAVATPPCGWPLVVFVHRLGATRFDDRILQETIAAQGYAVWSYDVRGQGFAILRNLPTRGSTMWGLQERADLVEQVTFVAGRYPGLVDTSRLAVAGSSQGGVHAWAAAASSGQVFTVPGRGAFTMPPVACVVANDYVAEPLEDWVRGRLMFSTWFVTLIADDTQPPFVLDAGFRAQARAAFVAQDPAGLVLAWEQEGRRIDQMLASSTVPVLYSHAYYDLIDSPLQTLRVLDSMPSGTPTRTLMSTIGHNTPQNLHELAYRDSIIERWLHRFLWLEHNEVELESPFVLSIVPLEQSRRDDPNHPWGRSFGSSPLQRTGVTRLHLHENGDLSGSEPVGPGQPTTIDQVIGDPNFTPTAYVQSAAVRAITNVLQACPLSERVFQSAPLAAEAQIDGSPRISLMITPDRARWMAAALLTVQPPGGQEVMLASRGFGSDQSQNGVPERAEYDLPPVAARLPAGTVIRMYVRNLWLREYPMQRQLEAAPLFGDFRLAVAHDVTATGSHVDLPLRQPSVELVSRTLHLDHTRMEPLQLLVRAGTPLANGLYYITAGVSGQVPGTWRHGTHLAVQSDWMSGIVGESVLLPEFHGFLGFLDGGGNGTATMNVSAYAPLDPSFVGMRLTFGAFAFPGFTMSAVASNPLDILLR